MNSIVRKSLLCSKPCDGQGISANISGQGGGGGGGGEGGCHPTLEILTIACLTFCLLLADRPSLGLPEYKLNVVNICKMHGILKLRCYELFDEFHQYVENVRKIDEKYYNSFIGQCNDLKSTDEV